MEKTSFGLRKWKVLLTVLHVVFLIITLAGISRNSYYKYKREIRQEQAGDHT